MGSYNHWLLVRRVKKFGEAVAENKKMYSLGTLTRMAGAVLATVIAVRYPEYFHLPSVIFGLVTMYVVIMIDYAYLQVFKKSQP
ncbi:ATP synthase subunit I [Bacillus coahuilensis]|uniref:ATP synthase subunit I n=1 Tax=Bacillus coahuilensis TaxID=408580 RepID=UPI003B43D438